MEEECQVEVRREERGGQKERGWEGGREVRGEEREGGKGRKGEEGR